MRDDNARQVQRSVAVLALEQRMLLDGAAVATALDTVLTDPLDDGLALEKAALGADLFRPATGAVDAVFIDTSIEGYEALLAGIPKDAEVFFIDGSRDGLDQMVAALAGDRTYRSIQVYSHGDAGRIVLGGTTLTLDTVSTRADDLAAIGRALTADGDLLFFGCNVAATADGEALIDRLADLTGADVAASVDLTGGLASGADANWDLEYEHGQVQATSLVDQRVRDAFASTLLTGWTGVGSGSLQNDDNANADEFGWSVAIADNTGLIAVGGYAQGDVYVYRPTGGGEYVQYKLPAGSAGNGTAGATVDVDGNFVIVGYASLNRIYIYQLNTVSNTWAQVYTATGANGFGASVTIQADGTNFRAAVGAPGANHLSNTYVAGSVSVFFSTNSGTTWTAGGTLTTTDGRWDGTLGFGRSVSLDGNRLVVGAPGWGFQTSTYGGTSNYQNVGRAYVYDWAGNAAIDGTIDLFLQPDGTPINGLNADASPDVGGAGPAGSYFGTSVSVSFTGSGSYFYAAGAPWENAGIGESYVYVTTAATGTPGNNGNQVPALPANSRFGWSVAIDAYSQQLIVGAYQFDDGGFTGTLDGAAYAFRAAGGWTTISNTFGAVDNDSRLGWSVAAARSHVVIGAPYYGGATNRNGLVIMGMFNATPTPATDSLTVTEGTGAQQVNVLINDTDPDFAGNGGSIATMTGGVDVPKIVYVEQPDIGAVSVVTDSYGYTRLEFNASDPSLDFLSFGQSVVIPITYTMVDSGGESVDAVLNVTVNGSNDTPANGEAIPLQIVNAGSVNYLFTYGNNPMSPSRLKDLGVFIDPDERDFHTFRFWNGSSALTTFTPSGGPTFTINDYVAASYSQTGNTVTVTYTGHGLTVGQVICLDYRTGAGSDNQYTVTSVIDANNFTVTEAVSQTTSGNVALLRAPGEITVTGATAGMVGTTYNLLPLRVTDNNGAFFTQALNWQVRVDRANVAPVATGGTLNVTAWEDNFRPGTYSQAGTTVTIVSPTAHGLTVGSSVALDYLSGLGLDNTYTVASVVNATTFTVTETVSQTTSGNTLFSVSPYVAVAGQFSDADSPSEELSYSLVGAPNWITISPVTGTLQISGSNGDIPTSPATFTVRATDMYMRTADKTVTVTLNPVNDAPAVTNSVPFSSAYIGQSYAGTTDANSILVLPSDLFTDIDLPTANTFTVRAYVGSTEITTGAGSPAWLRFNSTTNRFYTSGNVSGNIYDVITVRVVATDNGSPAMSSEYYFDINLFAPPQNGNVLAGAAANNGTGYSVAVSENGLWMAVGEPEYDGTTPLSGYKQGRVMIYRWTGAAWEFVQALVDPTPANDERFGFSLDISSDGDRLVVGTPGTSSGTGTVYGFTRSGGASFAAAPNFTYTQGAGDNQAGDAFGFSVAINRDGSKFVVGAPGDDAGGTEAGAVYLFNWGSNTSTKRLPVVDSGETANNQHYDRFGYSVAYDGNVVVVGAPFDTFGTNGLHSNGSVTILGVSTAFNGAVLKRGGEASYDMLGWSVSVDAYRNASGDVQNSSLVVVAGAPGSDLKDADAGAVYGYRWSGISDTVSQAQLNTLVEVNSILDKYSFLVLPFDGQNYDGFGQSVAIDVGNASLTSFNNDVKDNGIRIAVGSRMNGDYGGTAYLFRAKTDWTWLGQTYNQVGVTTTAAGNQFGWAVALSNNPTSSYSVWSGTYTVTSSATRLVIGAPSTDVLTNATYAQSGTTVTVTTAAAHGLAIGQTVYLDFTSGTGTDTPAVITGVGANTFTATVSLSATQAAGATVTYNTMGGNGSVHSVSSASTLIELVSGLLSDSVDKWLDTSADAAETVEHESGGTVDPAFLSGTLDKLFDGEGGVDVLDGLVLGGMVPMAPSYDVAGLQLTGYGATRQELQSITARGTSTTLGAWQDRAAPLPSLDAESPLAPPPSVMAQAVEQATDPLLFLLQTRALDVAHAPSTVEDEAAAAGEGEAGDGSAPETDAAADGTAFSPALSRQLQSLGDRHARASASLLDRLSGLTA